MTNPIREWATTKDGCVRKSKGVPFFDCRVQLETDFSPPEDGWAFPVGALEALSKKVRFIALYVEDFKRRIWTTPDRALEEVVSKNDSTVVVPQWIWTRNPQEFGAKDKEFVHLHVRSDYSYHESTARVRDIAERIARLGQRGVALTDRHRIMGGWKFRKEVALRNKTGIVGATVSVCVGSRKEKIRDDFELVLLAMNDLGWKNLLQLVSDAWLEGFYYKPRTDHETLKKYSEGLVCLTSGINGQVLQSFAVEDDEEAFNEIRRLEDIFGDDLYFEIAPWADEFSATGMRRMIQHLDEDRLERVVVTGDVQWTNPWDNDIARILKADSTRKKRVILDPEDLVDPALKEESEKKYEEALKEAADKVQPEEKPVHHLSTADELREMFERDHPGIPFESVDVGIANTVRIFERFEPYEIDKSFKFPKSTSGVDVVELSRSNLEDMGLMDDPKYVERFEMEAKTITELGYIPYFDLMNVLMTYMEEHEILKGPGRGSAAGSLFSYGLKITDLDPLEHGLIFERFINKDRIGLPDIDIDIDSNKRNQVYSYLTSVYPNTANIPTAQMMKGKNAIKCIYRACGLAFSDAEILSKDVPDQLQNAPPNSLIEALMFSPVFKKKMEKSPEIIEAAIRLEGTITSQGKHPAGLVVSPVPLESSLGLLKAKTKGEDHILVQADMRDVDGMGFIKLDLLGSETVTAVENALLSIFPNKRFLEKIRWLKNIPLDDVKTIKYTRAGDTRLSFQFNSNVMRQMLQTIQPERFGDFTAGNALIRPGANHWIDTYAEGTYRPSIKEMWPIVEDTRGVILYQEQAMRCASDLAGFPMTDADNLRKAIGKKLPELMRKMGDKFISGCVKNGIDEHKARSLFENIRESQNYSFNKSHAAAYALLAFWTIYLYAHYPEHYIAGYLNARINKKDHILIGIDSIHRSGLQLLPPSLQDLSSYFKPEDGGVRLGAACLPHVTPPVVRNIREAAPFESLKDFAEKVQSNIVRKPAKMSLALTGVFDGFGPRKAVYDVFSQGLERKKTWDESELEDAEDWHTTDRVRAEADGLGFVLSNPMKEYRDLMVGRGWRAFKNIHGKGYKLSGGLISDMHVWVPKTSKTGEAMARFDVNDGEGGGQVLVWASAWPKFENMNLRIGDLCFFKVYPMEDDPGMYAVGPKGDIRRIKMFYAQSGE